MIQFLVGNVDTQIVGYSRGEWVWVDALLSYTEHYFKGKARLERTISLLHAQNDTFATGLLPHVLAQAKACNIPFQLVEKRAPIAKPSAITIPWLRDYQKRACEIMLAKERGIVNVATGGGKTETAFGMVETVPIPWAFSVHRAALLDQTSKRYEDRTGKKAGRIGDGVWDVQDFTVCMFQSLHSAIHTTAGSKFFKSRLGVIFDEVHTIAAKTFYQVSRQFSASRFRLGLSATALKRTPSENLYTIAATGPVIFTLPAHTLITKGVLAKPTIRMIPVIQKVDIEGWSSLYDQLVVRSAIRNLAVARAILSAEKPCLVFVEQVNHGIILQAILEEVGMGSEFAQGSMDTGLRNRSVTRLVRGDFDVLFSTKIFQEGKDIPEIRSVVIACGGKSVIGVLQKVGRGMRLSYGKDEFEVWDIDDRGNKVLSKHTRDRMKAYTSEQFDINIEKDMDHLPMKLNFGV